MFRNQGPGYFGDNDEGDTALAEKEEELARDGVYHFKLGSDRS